MRESNLSWLFGEAPELAQKRAALGQFLERAGIVAGDVSRGVNKAAADAVSVPVDGMSWAMRKAGIPVGAAPVASSAWMRETGLVQEPVDPRAGMAGELIGALLPALAAAKAPVIAAGATAIDNPFISSTSGPMSPQLQRGVIDLKAAARLLDDLRAGKGSGAYRLGDVTEGQARQLQRLGIRQTASRDVMMTDDVLRHMHDKRVVQEGFSPEEVARFAEQALAKGAKAELDTAKVAQHPALVNRGLRDAAAGRPYNARMPMRSDGENYVPRTVYPGRLAQKKQTPSTMNAMGAAGPIEGGGSDFHLSYILGPLEPTLTPHNLSSYFRRPAPTFQVYLERGRRASVQKSVHAACSR